MGDSSDDELEIERVSSQKAVKEYEVVPEDTKFVFKFKNTAGKSYSLMEYNLMKGKELPYTTTIKGVLGRFVCFVYDYFSVREKR